jgi:hypothetical protein
MNLATQIIAATFVVILVAVGVMEIFFHAARRLYPLTLIEPGDAAAVRMWAMNIGAYNIAFAAGIAAGLVLVKPGQFRPALFWCSSAARAICCLGCGSGSPKSGCSPAPSSRPSCPVSPSSLTPSGTDQGSAAGAVRPDTGKTSAPGISSGARRFAVPAVRTRERRPAHSPVRRAGRLPMP